MKVNELAPIGITVYKRLNHLKQTVEALKRNSLALHSNVYFFSDAAKEGDELEVSTVRDYLKTIKGFKHIEIIYRDSNSRVFNNTQGQKYLLNKYGKMIWMAEDIVTAPGFLSFMNEGLKKHKDRDDILCITGYTPPFDLPNSYTKDAILLDRMYGWSLAIWKDRYNKILPITKQKLKNFLDKNNNYEKMISKGEYGLLYFMKLESMNLHYGLDARANFLQLTKSMSCLLPKVSLVHNIGNDGSGLHTGKTKAFDTVLSKKLDFELEENLIIDENILKSHNSFRRKVCSFRNSQVEFNSILNQLEQQTSFSVISTNFTRSLMFIEFCKRFNHKINYLISNNLEKKYKNNEYKILKLQEAISEGERNFIILSLGNKIEMKETILRLCPSANVVMFEPVTKEVVKNIESQLIDKKILSASIWGIDNISEAFSSNETIMELKINNYIDSNPNEKQKLGNIKVVKIQEAISEGERNFIILSLGNKIEMKETILRLCPSANVVMFEPVTKEVVKNIESQLIDKKILSASIWGIDNISEAFSSNETIMELKINNYIDSNPNEKQKLGNIKVVKIQEAISEGERNFIILSLGNKIEMKETILRLCPSANVVMFEP